MAWQHILFYKPYGVLSQFTDRQGTSHPTLKEFISIPDIYPIGRLDRDSEGLLLLSNHGGLQHQLCNPKFGHPRTYWVQVENIPDRIALQKLKQGVTIRNYRTRPTQASLLAEPPKLPLRTPPIRFRKHIPTAWMTMTLYEGRNRQVRRMTAAVGFPTLRLVRVAIAHLQLQDLQPGQWRHLSPIEIDQLQSLTHLSHL